MKRRRSGALSNLPTLQRLSVFQTAGSLISPSMETAPLTLAHTHARNAVLETRKSNPVAASEEHDLAAGEFAAAAQNISDREALRTLQLLENHHKKLAQILRFQHEHPAHAAAADASVASSVPATTPSTTDKSGVKTPSSGQDTQQHPPRPSVNTRLPPRETSSIASNLASARGIPSHPRRASPASPALSSQKAGAKMAESPTRTRTGEMMRGTPRAYRTTDRPGHQSTPKQSGTPTAVSPTAITCQQVVPANADHSSRQRGRFSVTEEPFQRFYSTFEGLISKLSAPLAFAGLPLGPDTSAQDDATRRRSATESRLDRYQATSDRASSSSEPDVSRLFSPAALRAIRASNGGTTGSPAESFYVVPTTGGTVSYAGILTRAEKDAQRNNLEELEEDFVDARETASPADLRQSMTGAAKNRRLRGADQPHNHQLVTLQNPKTMEELQMENQALKHLSDTLSKRLHMWEVNAQSSSIALQQSLKAMHHPAISPDSTSATALPTALASAPSPQVIADLEQRIRDLETNAHRIERERERQNRENEKLKVTLSRYRERWEKLKEGAKIRRAEAKLAGENPNPVAATGSKEKSVADDANASEKAKKETGPALTPTPAPLQDEGDQPSTGGAEVETKTVEAEGIVEGTVENTDTSEHPTGVSEPS